jgi:hypothetical protein
LRGCPSGSSSGVPSRGWDLRGTTPVAACGAGAKGRQKPRTKRPACRLAGSRAAFEVPGKALGVRPAARPDYVNRTPSSFDHCQRPWSKVRPSTPARSASRTDSFTYALPEPQAPPRHSPERVDVHALDLVGRRGAGPLRCRDYPDLEGIAIDGVRSGVSIAAGGPADRLVREPRTRRDSLPARRRRARRREARACPQTTPIRAPVARQHLLASAARTVSSSDASRTKTRVQPLELAFRHRVEVDAPNALAGQRRCNQRRRISAARRPPTKRGKRSRSRS